MESQTRSKKIVILFSGPHASGKTTVAKAISEKLGLRYFSTGELFRKKAKELGMSLIEFTKYVDEHPEVDYEIDSIAKEEIKKGDVVLDSQLAYFFAKEINDPDIIKISIMLHAPLKTRIERLMERENLTYDEAAKELSVREKREYTRFKRLYNVDLWRPDDFDVIVNTSNMDKNSVIDLCLAIVEKLIKCREEPGEK
ncbi:MAG: cytidylate kinase family protein [Crenarchaeota archaeon]|nr:cytidylate kinase family protein [Thermoproteota archaeon]MCR8471545.1 cytidylate kinase family protein [Thermoproteota archaeon]MCR8472721.1 cytidylate kinase family protein [Thermoproteota archaeon]MCR8488457.1 cytidylate kinase family protein [Thermoproteota archaeon]